MDAGEDLTGIAEAEWAASGVILPSWPVLVPFLNVKIKALRMSPEKPAAIVTGLLALTVKTPPFGGTLLPPS